ncbi:hypothetical protein CRM22_008611 [Opisthorchis felineus]|uniref:EGF-like domain-containing protein n=1 Tax=Opisthorchis felineus TaxID=147828 RepID=A0A4S2LB56_OPIFE|nr:hypothetical protein CRM22_008611 [Opisthorchis felineus]
MNVVILLCLLLSVRAEVNLLLTVRNYENKNNLDSRLRKCEALSFLGDNCDPIFQLTVHVTNSRNERHLLLRREAGPFANKKVLKEVLQTSSTQREFPSVIEIALDIYDNDADEDQLIARFRRIIPLLRTGQLDLQMGSDVKVKVLLKVECATNYYGERCEIYCQPSPQLWTCNSLTGARMCNKPCIQGSCVLTNTSAVCVCAPGWSGEFCRMPSDSTLITSMILPEIPIDPPTEDEHEEGVEDSGDVETSISSSAPAVRTQTMAVMIPSSTVFEAETKHEELPPLEENLTTLEAMMERLPFSNKTERVWEPDDYEQHEFDYLMANITKATSGHISYKHKVYIVAVVVLVFVAVCLAFSLVGGILFYRLRLRKRGSDHSGSIWTNTSYDISSGSLLKPFTLDYPAGLHKYENTIGSPSQSVRTNSTLSGSIILPRSGSGIRTTLPNIPSDQLGERTPPPVFTGTKIRFAATRDSQRSSTHYSLQGRPSLCVQQSPNNTEPYEELSAQPGEYSIWRSEPSTETTQTGSTVETSTVRNP